MKLLAVDGVESRSRQAVAARTKEILSRYQPQHHSSFATTYGACAADQARALSELVKDGDFGENNTERSWALAAVLHRAADFDQMLATELDELRGVDAEARPPVERAKEAGLLGVAFSGGGIRSATFNLGVLQGLAKRGVLDSVDYVSTVSGGGYIGSWLAAWIRHSGFKSVKQELSSDEPKPSSPINFLREYSNYLAPRPGMFSADTWTIAMVWLRNSLLNLLILIACICTLLLIPRTMAKLLDWAEIVIPETRLVFREIMIIGAGGLLLLAAVVIARNLKSFDEKRNPESNPLFDRPSVIQLGVVIPILAACWMASARLWFFVGSHWKPDQNLSYPWEAIGLGLLGPSGIFGALMLVMMWLGGFIQCYLRETDRKWFDKVGALAMMVFIAVACGAVFGGLLLAIGRLFWDWVSLDAEANWHVTAWGTPLLLQVFSVAMIIQIGLMGRNFPDDRREWISRLGAWLFISSLGVLGVFAVAIYGPWGLAAVVKWAENYWIKTGLSVGWLLTTAAGVIAGQSSRTDAEVGVKKPLPARVLEVVAGVAPYVFIAGLFILLSGNLLIILARQVCGDGTASLGFCDWVNGSTGFPTAGVLFDEYWVLLAATPWSAILVTMGILLAVVALFTFTVDVNEFSMHHFYKNRLVRCYLGASNPVRAANRFTGFDPSDDLPLATFLKYGERPYDGPYPIINVALNLVSGEKLSWQERKATSFVFTPRFSGYQFEDGEGTRTLESAGYRPTYKYAYPNGELQRGGIHIGTAMAISGAAASPNMGYHSSPPIAFLLTVFNVRLGWWLGNPRRKKEWKRAGPRLGLNYLLAELFGMANDRRAYLYLSDGGHFENLGIYELVRRRCSTIIACDAEQDGDMTFGGLGNAIRKCRTDFGVDIDIDVDSLRKKGPQKLSEAHVVLGTIRYPDGYVATLIYVKSTLTGEEPADVREYADRAKDFPHQTTGDQFFDESQFESYRKLGEHIACDTFESYKLLSLFQARADESYQKVWQQHLQSAEVAAAVAADLVRPAMSSSLRLPSQPEELRDAVRAGAALIPKMEAIFQDLIRDERRLAPYLRPWINLLSRWAHEAGTGLAWAAWLQKQASSVRAFACRLGLSCDVIRITRDEAAEEYYLELRTQPVQRIGYAVVGESNKLISILIEEPYRGMKLSRLAIGKLIQSGIVDSLELAGMSEADRKIVSRLFDEQYPLRRAATA